MSLTTPVIRDEDSVFPGENWFLYWKTSASLWKTKIESRNDLGSILVPINWSFHSDTGDSYDFAVEKPETDLNKLAEKLFDQGGGHVDASGGVICEKFLAFSKLFEPMKIKQF